MSNQWFKFKQFTISQDRCAMKVGTDGVILGAWTAIDGAARALDIGTGTGLLALMLAQRSELLTIDALELDRDTALQAAQNVAGSRFHDRITVINEDFRTYDPGEDVLYDLLICNPPYFIASKKPFNRERSLARHTDTLGLNDLFTGSAELLSMHGRLSIIVPAEGYAGAVEEAGQAGLHPARMLYVHPLPGANPKRVCIEFHRKEQALATERIVLETGQRHAWTEDYRLLTKEFYLAL
jgi:tRNA1Val (adenine37-N6)-methyltransferase